MHRRQWLAFSDELFTLTPALSLRERGLFEGIQIMSEDAPGRPNIIVILVDDMGYSDIGCFGSEIRTPNLDSLAEGGLRFSQMYNSARCCPSRAALLTGLNPHQAGVGHMVANLGVPEYQGIPEG